MTGKKVTENTHRNNSPPSSNTSTILSKHLPIPSDVETNIASTKPPHEDNQGSLLMANFGQPTKRTRRMDVKYFAIHNWIENDLLVLARIDTSDNESDTMTKNVGRTLFYRHQDYLMGEIIPEYAKT